MQKQFIKYSFLAIMLVTSTFVYALEDEEVSNEIGIAVSNYRYIEPHVMKITATNITLDYIGTIMLDSSWFFRGDVLGSMSYNPHYSSERTGEGDKEKNWYLDVRGLYGKKTFFDNTTLAWFFGAGYRYLNNDGRGQTSTGHYGYRRESNYFYLPLGLVHTTNLGENSRLITTTELDVLLIGRQDSYLSDVTPVNSDFTNWQKSGIGARFSCMYQLHNWSLGPYLTYWNIAASTAVIAQVINARGQPNGNSVGILEPHNYTFETGLRLSYHF